MTPEIFWQFVREFGLPFALVSLGLVGIIRGWVVTRGEYMDKQAETDGWRALYERERTDRMAAEQGLVKTSAASVDVAQALRDALEKIVGQPDVYAERLEGNPRRGR